MKTKSLFFVLCLLLTGCMLIGSQPTDTVTPAIQPTMSTLPNPASAYCEQQGNKIEIRTAADGSQTGTCIFPDGSECDEWVYFRGECTPASQGGSMPNPASAFCEQKGYKLEIRTAGDGSQTGACIFPNGSECDEWAYFRGECQPATNGTPAGNSEYDDQGWKIYTNDVLGYSFHYPAEAQVTTNDDPIKSLTISGSGLDSESWSIAHPSDRDDYRPPEGVDLLQWLTDHNLLGEIRLSDVQVAGTTAIHFRHERSPQSYADDRYFFAHAGQLYMIIIGHSSDVEDWELNNRFLQNFQFDVPPANASVPTPIPTPLPIDPSGYQDWVTYTHPMYNFSIKLPNDWIVEEVASAGPGMEGHILNLHPADAFKQENIRMTFRSTGEDTLLWPTGVGQGEFIPQNTLDVAGQPALRLLLVCPTGEVTSIWFHQNESQPNLLRGDLEFGFIFNASSTHCQGGYSLNGEAQLVGEMIIASLQVR